jgi:hypothetical protein
MAQAALRALATQLTGLPSLSHLVCAAGAAGLQRLPSLGASAFYARAAHSGDEHSSHKQHGERWMSALAQTWPDEGEEEAGDPGGLEDADYEVQRAQLAALSDDQVLSTEGEVFFDDTQPLMQKMQDHWRSTPPEYRQRVSFDEFGERYLRQMQKEDDARTAALRRVRQLQSAAQGLDQALGGASTSGSSSRPDELQGRMGHWTKQLLCEWLPLLEEAIEQEQLEVRGAAARWQLCMGAMQAGGACLRGRGAMLGSGVGMAAAPAASLVTAETPRWHCRSPAAGETPRRIAPTMAPTCCSSTSTTWRC